MWSPNPPGLCGSLHPLNMLFKTQIEELKLKDEWEAKCVPSGGAVINKDPIGRRNGHGRNSMQLEIPVLLHDAH